MRQITINCHSSIKIEGSNQIIYFDPYKIEETVNDADIIFFTHDHYDHISTEDIKKVIKKDTILIVPESCKEKIQKNFSNEIISVIPNNEYSILDINFKTIPAYNTNKSFHPKENNWVGYIVNLDELEYYIAGDTDITEENKKVKCDIALIPIGGTYTMDYKEAAILVNEIKPQIAIPTHYGLIVGNKEDGLKFKNLLASDIDCQILI